MAEYHISAVSVKCGNREEKREIFLLTMAVSSDILLQAKERRASPSSPRAVAERFRWLVSGLCGTVSGGVFRPFFIFSCNRLEVLNN